MSSAGKIGPALVALTTVALLLTGLALAGCGSSGNTTTGEGGETATTSTAPLGASVKSCQNDLSSGPALAAGASCAEARSTVAAWVHTRSCMASAGASRSSCAVGKLRCLSTRTQRGLAVSCARPGRSISFSVAPDAPR